MKTKKRPLWKRALRWMGFCAAGIAGVFAVTMVAATLLAPSKETPPQETAPQAAETGDAQEALIEAARSGNVNQLHEALEAGADPNLRDDAGETLLHWLARNPDVLAFYGYLDRAEHPNSRNNAGQTALHVAAEVDNPDAVGDLLGEKVDPCIRDGEGRLPYDIAKHKTQFNIEGLNKFALGRLKFADCN